jgi:hypothetical protein
MTFEAHGCPKERHLLEHVRVLGYMAVEDVQ